MPDALIQSKNFATRSDKTREKACIYKRPLALFKNNHELKDNHGPPSGDENDHVIMSISSSSVAEDDNNHIDEDYEERERKAKSKYQSEETD